MSFTPRPKSDNTYSLTVMLSGEFVAKLSTSVSAAEAES